MTRRRTIWHAVLTEPGHAMHSTTIELVASTKQHAAQQLWDIHDMAPHEYTLQRTGWYDYE